MVDIKLLFDTNHQVWNINFNYYQFKNYIYQDFRFIWRN